MRKIILFVNKILAFYHLPQQCYRELYLIIMCYYLKNVSIKKKKNANNYGVFK